MSDPDVSHILQQIESGDPIAADRLLPLVYEELRKLAAVKLAQEKPGQTLQATALVHEAYLRLVDQDGLAGFANRRHFFAAAAEAMRRILVDQARHKLAVRHGGDWRRVPELPAEPVASGDAEQTVIIHDLLDHLGTNHPRQVEVAKMRLFLQMTLAEISEVLSISPDTAESDWAFARAWLKRAWGQRAEKHTS
ncbi:MAG TPA: ECF-type sigma factor [Planctomycetaceae bacterium]|nr:ECF-type sigma factor [Planctomycetaceae bacterium]